jgi:hypothetical protein
MLIIPAMWEVKTGRIAVQANQGETQHPISKIA